MEYSRIRRYETNMKSHNCTFVVQLNVKIGKELETILRALKTLAEMFYLCPLDLMDDMISKGMIRESIVDGKSNRQKRCPIFTRHCSSRQKR